MNTSPNGKAIPRYCLNEEMPDIIPYGGSTAPLLGNVYTNIHEISIAERVLGLHHEYLKEEAGAFQIGPNELLVFNYFWAKVAECGHTAVSIPVCETTDGKVFLSLHSDLSAIIWCELPGQMFVPITEAFFLNLRPGTFHKPDLIVDTPTMRGEKLSLSEFIEHASRTSPGGAEITYGGDLDFEEALRFEVEQWLVWAKNTALKSMKDFYEDTKSQSIGTRRVYPWMHDMRLTDQNQLTCIDRFCRMLSQTLIIHEDITVGYILISIRGRSLSRYTEIGELEVNINFDLRSASSKILAIMEKWCGYIRKVMDHPTFDVPMIAQISQNMDISETRRDFSRSYSQPYTTGKLREHYYDVDQEDPASMSAHQKIELINAMNEFGVPLPEKG